ncbi:F5/8_type C domain-containing protein [Hexamita inflata]|uniref:F5/8 type C domain-containing protein n=1 Tax=Hexamita inflata TaxID=28002 RepID=A0AA86UBF1_9EUKA|nr:F5/8 type C domain-containing protein [Hexamita inflata]
MYIRNITKGGQSVKQEVIPKLPTVKPPPRQDLQQLNFRQQRNSYQTIQQSKMTQIAEKKIDTNITPKSPLQKEMALKLSQEIGNVTRTASDCYNYDDFQYGSRHSNLDGPKCWCPRNLQGIYGQFLEFDFHKQVFVGQIITQGKLGGGWVSRYKVEYFLDGEWRQGGKFEGNSDGDTKAVRETKIVAEKLRIFPLKFKDNIHLRVDVSISEDICQFNILKVVEENNARVISELDAYKYGYKIYRQDSNTQNINSQSSF